MSMPKGFKAQNGYATVVDRGGLGYREIAEVMTSDGDPMKHSAARNYFLSGMRKLAEPICEMHGIPKMEIDRIALDPRFQESVADLIGDLDPSDFENTEINLL
tara:strand:- start:674 stop:982 length:309 start_codon:yes stop_codon:yes gene_type:complete